MLRELSPHRCISARFPAFCKQYRLPVSTAGSDTSVIQESGMYHSLHTMFVNACKTKCDRVIEKLDYCARENRKLIP